MDNRKETQENDKTNGMKQRNERLVRIFFPNVENTLKISLNLSPNITTIMTELGNIRSYIDSIYRKSRVPMQTRHTNSRPSF